MQISYILGCRKRCEIMEYNILKIKILSILAKHSDMSYLDVLSVLEEYFDINPSSIQMALMRYYRQGLLDRWKNGRYYRYNITEKGIERLDWLESTMIEKN